MELNLLLKVIAMIIDFIALLVWCIADGHDNAMGRSHLMHILFAMTVPGYAVILTGMVVMYLVGEEPGKWFQRLFIVTGFILFAIVGIIGLINCLDRDRGTYPLIISILCIVDAIILIVDFIKAEGII